MHPAIERASQTPRVPQVFKAVARPVEQFFRLEASSGLLLLGAAVVALTWANLGGAESYRATFEAPVALRLGSLAASFTVRQLVNDGLMALFFFVVGMEIKRELVLGELRTVSQAALPLVAAVGGMVVPAAVYLAFNASGPGRDGWGVPMATDIAFAIGVLSMLRSRVPHALVVFLTALAIFDDIGGILVIAFFYGSGVSGTWVAIGAVVYALALLLSRWHVRRGLVWGALGAVLWYATHHAGIHPTIAGVLLGLAIPARARVSAREVIEALAHHAKALVEASKGPSEDEEMDSENVRGIERALEVRESPLGRLEGMLHPWVAYGVMPIFALANSGVEFASLSADRMTGSVALGTALALFVGKQLGIFGFTIAAVKLGLTRLPAGATWGKVLGVSIIAGIGFTVALFIAGLAFPAHPGLLDEAKIGIIAGSFAAGVAGALVLRATRRVRP